MRRLLAAAAMLAASAAFADGRFSASDVPGAGIRQPGKIVIRNSGSSITAYHFFGNIREALFSIRSSPARLRMTPFGPAVYDSGARMNGRMPAFLASLIGDAARTHGVDPRLVAAIALRESDFDVRSVSTAGACGVMQLMPETARFLGVGNIFDPRDNVFGGARYLRTLLDTFNGDLDLTLAAYNAGPGAVQKYGGVPPYRETRAYVKSVRATYENAIKSEGRGQKAEVSRGSLLPSAF
jgi:soluble lytic murein transglycosylase-like protein